MNFSKKIKNLSVTIPVYNVEKYITDCIQSVILQTLKDIGIIIINDGSTDDSISKIRNLIKENDNIFVINKKSGGLSSAVMTILRGDS